MSGWELKIIAAEAHRLVALAAEDDDLRTALRALAESILAATAAASPPEVIRDDPAPPEPLRELTLGRSRPPSAPEGSPAGRGPSTGFDPDLAAIAAQCRRKATAARWAARCQGHPAEGADPGVVDGPTDPEMVAWAGRLTDSFYWTNAPDASQPSDPARLDDVGGWFEAVAEALALLEDGRGRRAGIETMLPLLAEAQAGLRQALRRLGRDDDPDQLAAFECARDLAARHRLFLRRHMRADDPPDPSGWPDLLARIGAAGRSSRSHHPRLERLRPLLDALREGRGSAEHWRAAVAAVEELIGAGVPPSSRELRELLLPVVDALPDLGDLPPGFRVALREIDRYLATRPAPSAPACAHPPAAEVAEAARLLAGRRVVLIGGIRHPGAQEALEAALNLAELIWIETKEHQSIRAFEPAIARPDVALVLLAIRWSSHAFGDVKQYCDRHGTPLVRLPGGYGPHQVAAQILAQASTQLAGS